MTAEDLARWDVSLIERRLLSPAAWRELTTEVRLENGAGTGYGLGLVVGLVSDRRVLSHQGAVCGFTAENRVYPEERAAIVVLSNHEGSASGELADQIADQLFLTGSPADAEKLAQVRAIFLDLQSGTIDRSLLTPNANDYFSAEALGDFKASLGPLGPPKKFELKRQGVRGGLGTRVYRVAFDKQTLQIVTRAVPNGRLENYWVSVE
jgi:D-alanyl-D-alanine carboxypeptidase